MKLTFRPGHGARPAATRMMLRARRLDVIVGILLAVVVAAALVTGSVFGGLHSTHLRPKIVSGAASVTVLVIGVWATRRLARGLGGLFTLQNVHAFGTAVRLLVTGLGYLIVVFSVLSLLDVSIEHLLVGAGLAGVVLGIAAQQSLGNVFAGFVMVLARPFTLGDRIRIRSGALGGIFEATVLEASLTYVTLRTDDGLFKIPNSALLAAGIGVLPRVDMDEEAVEDPGAPGPAGTVGTGSGKPG